MTDQHPHPLTDEICEDLWQWFPKYSCEIEDADVRKVMRTAADWQLEQVIKCISTTLMDAYLYVDDSGDYAFNEGEFLKDLEKAMRPQEDN